MSFLGLVPIFQTVHSHISLASRRDRPLPLDSMRTYLEYRKEAFLGRPPTQDDLGSRFEYELNRATFGFLLEFLERNVTDPESSDTVASSHSEGKLPEGSRVDDNDETYTLNDPIDSLSNDGKGLEHQEAEEEMEDESEDDEIQDNKSDLFSKDDPVYSLSNDGKVPKDQEGEEDEMEDEPGDDTVHDNKGDLLSRHLVTDAVSLDSTHQPI